MNCDESELTIQPIILRSVFHKLVDDNSVVINGISLPNGCVPVDLLAETLTSEGFFVSNKYLKAAYKDMGFKIRDLDHICCVSLPHHQRTRTNTTTLKPDATKDNEDKTALLIKFALQAAVAVKTQVAPKAAGEGDKTTDFRRKRKDSGQEIGRGLALARLICIGCVIGVSVGRLYGNLVIWSAVPMTGVFVWPTVNGTEWSPPSLGSQQCPRCVEGDFCRSMKSIGAKYGAKAWSKFFNTYIRLLRKSPDPRTADTLHRVLTFAYEFFHWAGRVCFYVTDLQRLDEAMYAKE
jgi:hypothetical protein